MTEDERRDCGSRLRLARLGAGGRRRGEEREDGRQEPPHRRSAFALDGRHAAVPVPELELDEPSAGREVARAGAAAEPMPALLEGRPHHRRAERAGAGPDLPVRVHHPTPPSRGTASSRVPRGRCASSSPSRPCIGTTGLKPKTSRSYGVKKWRRSATRPEARELHARGGLRGAGQQRDAAQTRGEEVAARHRDGPRQVLDVDPGGVVDDLGHVELLPRPLLHVLVVAPAEDARDRRD